MATVSGAIASTLFGAVSGSISSIKTIIEWVDKVESLMRQCGEAGETIRDIQELVKARKEELQQWRRLWNIDVTTKYAYQTELWGDEQIEVIRGKISAIEDLCSKFNDKFEVFFIDTQMSRLLHAAAERNSSISMSRSLAAFREDAKLKVDEASAWQIIDFVRNIKPQATDWLTELKVMLAELSETAIKAFFTRHREMVSCGLTNKQLEMVERSTLLQMALEMRQASEDLFHLCLVAKECVGQENPIRGSAQTYTWLKIDLTGVSRGVDLGNIPSQRGIQLIYHLVLEWEESPEEICIEGPLLDLDQARNIGSFIEAYRAVQRKDKATILIEPNLYFPSRGPRDDETLKLKILDEDAPLPKSLDEFIHALDELDLEDNVEQFPRTRRLWVAFKIVECGLFLAGTSWLSKLRSKTIRCTPMDRVKYHFTLNANDTAQTVSWQSFDQLALSMFRIGVLLIELGIGELVCGHRPGKICKFRDATFLMCKPGADHREQGQWRSFTTIVDILNTTMGNDYASATAFCLDKMRDKCGDAAVESTRSDIHNTYKKIFGDYFLNIYVPYVIKSYHIKSWFLLTSLHRLDKLAGKAAWADKHLEDVDGFLELET
jgi:hypothetical protein